ncbi:MAG: inosine monophosphate cyclohydrolase, partial [Clostridiales bacterium]|nr:inosine monophosphate cyclohydrolase [Clostridiales bacterium]
KMMDPSLIIYMPVKVSDKGIIISNGDQTDTIYDSFLQEETFFEALQKRTFEPDPPHYTPRISGLLTKGYQEYYLSIIKSNQKDDTQTERMLFSYENTVAGIGHFIHTYEKEEEGQLISFQGEPKRLSFQGKIEDFSSDLWNSLDSDNKISLMVRYIDKQTGASQTILKNKHHGE